MESSGCRSIKTSQMHIFKQVLWNPTIPETFNNMLLLLNLLIVIRVNRQLGVELIALSSSWQCSCHDDLWLRLLNCLLYWYIDQADILQIFANFINSTIAVWLTELLVTLSKQNYFHILFINCQNCCLPFSYIYIYIFLIVYNVYFNI